MSKQRLSKASFFLLIAAAVFSAGLSSCAKAYAAKSDGKGNGGTDSDSVTGNFTVIEVNPDGELPSSVKYPSVQIQFSEPVVALEKLGEPSDVSEYAVIEPSLEGVWRWFGTSLLSFESSDAAVPQKLYTVKVSDNIKSVSGKKISGKLEYTFHSEDLKITGITPGFDLVQQNQKVNEEDVPVDVAKKVGIYFNSEIDTAYVANEIKIYSVTSDGMRTDYNFKAEKKDTSSLVAEIRGDLPENADVFIELPAGSSAKDGYYATSETQYKSFHTLKPFVFTYFDDSPWYSQYSNPVSFNFSHNLTPGSEEEAAKHISTEPEMKITKDNVAVKNNRLVVFNLPVDYESKYTITVDGSLKDFWGRELGEGITEEVEVPAAASYASFKDYGFHILEAQFSPKLAFIYQNLKGGFYSVTGYGEKVPVSLSEKEQRWEVDPETLPVNEKCVETVDLTPFLNETPEGYRGAVRFAAALKYQRVLWNKEKRIDEQKNEQDILVTDLAITSRFSYDKAAVLVSRLSDGKPVAGAEVNIYALPDWRTTMSSMIAEPGDPLASGVTDAQGFVFLEHNYNQQYSNRIVIEAKTANDRVIYPAEQTNMYRTGIYTRSFSSPLYERARIFVFTDRMLYKPGETVTFRSIDRTLYKGEYTSYTGNYTIELEDGTWKHNVISSLSARASENGTCTGKFRIPEDLQPGSYEIRIIREDGSKAKGDCRIKVQYFERLRFEANAEIPELTYVKGDEIDATVTASYLGGGNMNDCSYSSYWTREPVGFVLKGKYEKYSFGPRNGWDGTSSLTNDEGTLNSEGKVNLSITTGGEKLKGKAYRYRVEASIQDSGNQNVAATAAVVVHPAKFYLGLSDQKKTGGFANKGEKVSFDYVAVSPEGEAPAESALPAKDRRKVNVEILREDWKEVQQVSWDGEINTRYEKEMITENQQELELNATGNPSEISFTPDKGGYYTIRISTEDSLGNEVITERFFYVFSSDWYWFNRNDSKSISLTADKDEYSVGDTAHILLQSPLPAGTYMITVEREDIVDYKLITLDVPSTVLDVKIEESYVPAMYVSVSSYSTRTAEPAKDYFSTDLGKPAAYFGAVTLRVSTETRSFNIDVKPGKNMYRPGENAEINLHVTDAAGLPLSNAEITLMAVDRGVIDLVGYHVPDPVEFFYNIGYFGDCVVGGDSRSLLIDPVTYEVKNLIGGDAEDKLNERKNFDPTAVFIPALITDENGNARAEFVLPDTLTAYRITAVGVKGNNFAIKENQIDVANPVSVRQVLPQKLRIDDEGEMGVVISNLENIPHDVNVSMKIYEGIEKSGLVQAEGEVKKLPGKAVVTGSSSKDIKVAAETTSPLMFNVKAVSQGWVTLEFIVKSDVVNEKILLPFEIEKPYIYETVTTLGEVSSAKEEGSASVKEQIVIPSDAEDGKGTVTVTLDTSRLGLLSESVDYLFHYPYGCMEQRSSAILPLVIFGDYIDVFGMASEVENPVKVAEAEVKTWGRYQKSDGGFPYWKDGTWSSSLVSARIAEIIGIADDKGLNFGKYIDKDALGTYLVSTACEILDGWKDSETGKIKEHDDYYSAYLFYAASMIGMNVSETRLEQIVSNTSNDLDTLSFAALTYINKNNKIKAKQISDSFKKYMKQNTRGVEILPKTERGSYIYGCFTRDTSEVYALFLSIYTQLDPDDEINQKLLFELLQQQRAGKGYWKCTVVTSRVLESINLYIRSNNLEDTDLIAEASFDGKKILSKKFEGLSAKAVDRTLSFTDELASTKRDVPLDLEVSKDGTGKLFYTASMKYAIPPARQLARDEGISLYTYVTDVKTGQVVLNNELEEGKLYRMTAYVSSNSNREFVAVRIPVPAGCEIVNAAFVTNGNADRKKFQTILPGGRWNPEYDEWLSEDSEDDYYEPAPRGSEVSNEAIYETQVQFFYNEFLRGCNVENFLFRASRKGTYNVPSATAECMYQEEIFGRSSGSVWTIR